MNTEERALRIQLAAAYRLAAKFDIDDGIFTHISVRVPGEVPTFLINPFGSLFEEITASSLVKIDIDGNVVADTSKIPDSGLPAVNPAGFSIHSAIHAARDDAHCVMHTHTTAGMAVAASETGLAYINQMSYEFYGRIGYYSYDMIRFPDSEKVRLVQCLGDNDALIMQNHGLITIASNVPEMFYLMFYLEKACKIQVAAAGMGQRVIDVGDAVKEDTAQFFQERLSPRKRMWDAFIRKLDRECPEYAS